MHLHRVLVVEDDRATRESLVVALETEGCVVHTAADGEEALVRLRTGFSPCAILLDIDLPRYNGWHFRLKQLNDPALAGIPVIVCSGHPEAPRGARLFGVPVMEKPIELSSLLGRLASSCRRAPRLDQV